MKLYAKLIVAMFCLATTAAQAGFQRSDWKTDGDRIVVTDTDTDLSWMNLGAVNGKSYNTINEELTTVYAGWRFATKSEIFTMLSHVWGFDVEGVKSVQQTHTGVYWDGARAFNVLFGSGGTTLNFTIGTYFDEATGKMIGTGGYVNGGQTYTYGALSGITASVTGSWGKAGAVYYTGAFLVKDESHSTDPDPVPVPAPAIGLLFGAALLFGMRRKYQ